jgi:RHS repeat-associated protein
VRGSHGRPDGSSAILPAEGVMGLSFLADRLTAVTSASGTATLFTIDALGRHASRTVGTTPTESYSYLGSTNTVIGITAGSTTTTSAIDAVGNRVATASGGAVGFLLPDLHGNTAGALNSTCTALTDAFAYDAYGNTVASVTSALPTPWRYQGRILESAAGTPDLYDFGARSYSPTIGTFTSLDTLHGSAGNPALLNGYLYANANPATLVDPDGHCAGGGGYGGSCTDWESVGTSSSRCSSAGYGGSCASWNSVGAGSPRAATNSGQVSVQSTGRPGSEQGPSTSTSQRSANSMPECNYEVTTNCAATGPLDLTGSSPATTKSGNASEQAWAALADAKSQVLHGGNPTCNDADSYGCSMAISDELHIMCMDAHDDPSAPACAAFAMGTPSPLTQINAAGGFLTVTSALTLCAFGAAESLGAACLPLAGQVAYTFTLGGTNVVKNDGDWSKFLNGWNWVDATVAGGAAFGAEAVPGTIFAKSVAGFTLGIATDLVSQQYKHPGSPPDLVRAVCQGNFGMGAAGLGGKTTVNGKEFQLIPSNWVGSAFAVVMGIAGNMACPGG